ncbi:MAG: hypothetical protein SCALA702_20220 [Melioribacteraceae bacterium]|nr:MAG: hypothetical protein SCALA702_20220 [Melioribacteraceae bacterium]
MKISTLINRIAKLLMVMLFLVVTNSISNAQTAKWMAVGSINNWYSETGSEIEHGLVARQQYGLQWPAIYRYQDSQAAKGLWLGATDFTDENGIFYPFKVVHIGPRVSGANEIFPIRLEMVSRFDAPTVTVDGVTTYLQPVTNDLDNDPTMPYDRMIINEVNSQLGITMIRKIYAFSQSFHDNYIVHDVTYVNTGNTDDDADIELPNNTVTDFYAFYQYRLAINQNTRYVIGNGTGWGMNTMLDTRGDGVKNDGDANFRAQYAWHGKFPPFTQYDNIGGPIWAPDGTAYTTEGDTLGRLGATQFVGVVTLHADTSPADQTDDPGQPSTTSYVDSDHPLTSNNDAYNNVKMAQEYGWMSLGHMAPRHADKVEPSGNFLQPVGDPALGTSGGFSAANGYGPYTLAPGDSIRIVWAEGAHGLSREKSLLYGSQYKRGEIDALTKNQYVFQGKDSLFMTFDRAIENFNSGYNIPQPPLPPKFFEINSGGDRISLSWELYDDVDGPPIAGFEIYRATGQYDSTYYLIRKATADEREYDDTDLERGVNYYYYIVSVGFPTDNDGTGNTPAGALKSNRYYTQTYDPANLKRPAGTSLSQVRVVPNPYIISSDQNALLFPGEQDKLAFFNIPGDCTIQIFTEIGEKIHEIDHNDGSGDAYWNCVTSSNQIVVSGIYIAVITDRASGDRSIVKFAVIR